jgi:hypothetical protein
VRAEPDEFFFRLCRAAHGLAIRVQPRQQAHGLEEVEIVPGFEQ